MPRIGQSERKSWLTLAVVLGGLVIATIVGVRNLRVVDTRLARDEASAAGTIRSLTNAQKSRAAALPLKGFACDLQELHAEDHTLEFVTRPEYIQGGYSFSIRNCSAGPNGPAKHYDAVASPVDPGRSGIRAFCSDETSVIYYDSSGSADGCLSHKHSLR
jgi:hypothetical protein